MVLREEFVNGELERSQFVAGTVATKSMRFWTSSLLLFYVERRPKPLRADPGDAPDVIPLRRLMTALTLSDASFQNRSCEMAACFLSLHAFARSQAVTYVVIKSMQATAPIAVGLFRPGSAQASIIHTTCSLISPQNRRNRGRCEKSRDKELE